MDNNVIRIVLTMSIKNCHFSCQRSFSCVRLYLVSQRYVRPIELLFILLFRAILTASPRGERYFFYALSGYVFL